MIHLIKEFSIELPNSQESRTICIYQKGKKLYYVRVDGGDLAKNKDLNPSYELNTLNDILIYMPYFTHEDVAEIRKIVRKWRISKIFNKKDD